MRVLVPHVHGRDITKCYSLVLKKERFIEMYDFQQRCIFLHELVSTKVGVEQLYYASQEGTERRRLCSLGRSRGKI